MEYAELIVQIRKECSMSQEDFAKELGVYVPSQTRPRHWDGTQATRLWALD